MLTIGLNYLMIKMTNAIISYGGEKNKALQ